MNTTRLVSLTATWMAAAALLLQSPAIAAQKPKEWNPTINPADFVSRVDNTYMPLTPGTSMSYRGATREGLETLIIEVTRRTKVILGVTTLVVVETAALDGQVVEIAENWFAQDRNGDVWYFGEATRDFVNGVEVSTEGSWEAGVSGAVPGIVMKAHPAVGDIYFQEYAPGVAEDMASVLSITRTETVLGGSFSDVVMTKEWTALQSNSVEHKSYAPRVGLILEEKGGVRLELVSVR